MRLADEPDNKVVVTTRYVMDANSLIVLAKYDEDGCWQFLGEEEIDHSDTCLVSVSEILMMDDSLDELDLNMGQSAIRIDIDSSWQTIKKKY